LRERRLWNSPPNDIAGVTIRHLGKTWQMTRRDAYKWSVAPAPWARSIHWRSKKSFAAWRKSKPLPGSLAANRIAPAWLCRGWPPESASNEKAAQSQVEFGGEATSGLKYTAVTLDGELWIFEFPPALYQQVLGYLTIPPGVP